MGVGVGMGRGMGVGRNRTEIQNSEIQNSDFKVQSVLWGQIKGLSRVH